ncbi:MAG: flavodoxin domain-containing protein, partial [Syntrophales bacterium]
MKVLVVYYSMYGHIHRMAEAVAEGARMVQGADVSQYRVPETLSEDVLGKMGALEAQKGLAHVP